MNNGYSIDTGNQLYTTSLVVQFKVYNPARLFFPLTF